MLATCMFYQYTSRLRVSAQQYWISFKAATRLGNLSFIFSTNNFQMTVHVFVGETLEIYIYYYRFEASFLLAFNLC